MICTMRDIERSHQEARMRLEDDGRSNAYIEAWIEKFDERYDMYRDMYGWTPGGIRQANVDAGRYADEYAEEYEHGYLCGAEESQREFGSIWDAMDAAGLNTEEKIKELVDERTNKCNFDNLLSKYGIDVDKIEREVHRDFDAFLELRAAKDATPVLRGQLPGMGIHERDFDKFIDAYLEVYRDKKPAKENDVSGDWIAHCTSLDAARRAVGLSQ